MTRSYILGAVAIGLAIVPFAAAEQLPPHSDYYDQHPHQTTPVNDVGMLVYRKKAKANLYVQDFCLGTIKGQNGQPDYPQEAVVLTAHFRHHKISYSGPAKIFTQDGQRTVQMKLSAKLATKTASGTVEFPGTDCTKTSFTARRTGHTP